MGGGSNNAQQQAAANEAERQRQIADSTAKINSIFDSPDRQAQYDKLAADTTAYYTSDLDRQKAINDRKLKFALARSGNIGGSLQADQSRALGQDYLKGVVEASRRGQAAGANLRAADEQTRMNLIAMAQSGLDATTASSQATSALRGNLQSSMADSTANSLGDAFSDLGSIYNKSEDAKQFRTQYRNGLNLYSPMYGYGG